MKKIKNASKNNNTHQHHQLLLLLPPPTHISILLYFVIKNPKFPPNILNHQNKQTKAKTKLHRNSGNSRKP